MERIEDFLRGFSACIASVKMYPVTHPQFIKVVTVAYGHLRQILEGKTELIIGIVENEIVCENRVLFKISGVMELLISHAKKKNIEKFYFYPDIRQADFVNLISFLLSAEEITDHVDDQLRLAGVQHVKVSRLTTPEEAQKEEEGALSPHENALKGLSKFYEKFGAETSDIAAACLDLKLVVLNIREKLVGKHHELLSQQFSGGYSPDIIRSLGVGILAVTVASKIGFDPEEVRATGTASLLYNIGGAPGGGDTSGKQDPLRSAKMLLRYKEHFGILPVVVAFEQGQVDASRAHVVSLIIKICKYYDDLMNQAGGKEQAREKIRQLWSRDSLSGVYPQLGERFLKIVGA